MSGPGDPKAGAQTAEEVIRLLGLAPHPEGGFFRETFRDAASTSIYFLLRRGDVSVWHRLLDRPEVWHHYAGAPLELTVWEDGRGAVTSRLGSGLAAGERPQAVVAAGAWQTARSLGDWTLVGCTVAPAFDFAVFEMAPPGWQPG
ncbi:MAG TPA: cupin domain-containing protein [Thermoanaerobaculia bacterium]|nr:cupin domain-containing protein [Thermoanaerobaculia bacterium]